MKERLPLALSAAAFILAAFGSTSAGGAAGAAISAGISKASEAAPFALEAKRKPLRGPRGARGPAGPKGSPGTPGAPGPAGPAGPGGANGTNGTNGVDGTNGTNGANGVDGVNGTNGVDGKSVTWRGEWDCGARYQPQDAVSYEGSAWISAARTECDEPPSSSWLVMAAKGDKGDKGDIGTPGTNGTNGTNGAPGPGATRLNVVMANGERRDMALGAFTLRLDCTGGSNSRLFTLSVAGGAGSAGEIAGVKSVNDTPQSTVGYTTGLNLTAEGVELARIGFVGGSFPNWYRLGGSAVLHNASSVATMTFDMYLDDRSSQGTCYLNGTAVRAT